MNKNPFYYGGAIIDDHFCNRVDEIQELKDDISNGLNILIYAPRRFGKTSLVLKTLDELKNNENVEYVFFDMMHISTLDEFINKYFNLLAKTLEKSSDKVVKFFKSIIGLRPNINVRFDNSGNPNFSLNLSGEDKIQTLEDVLNIPLEFAQNKKIVVVFDEFQSIEHLEIEAKLRSVIQLHADKISYIFMGSKKSILHQMFLDKNRPFYKSVKHFKIDKIEDEVWIEYIFSRFIKTQKNIDEKYINQILKITKGFPYYTQQFAYELWSICEKDVDNKVFNQTLTTILSREEDLFNIELENLTQNQKKALKIILEKRGIELYDEEYLVKYKIKTGSMQTALKGLLTKDVVDKVAGKYYLQDPLFEYWMSK